MKILVTGGAGFIGSAVVRLALARGHSVVNVDALTYAACLENVASVADHPNYAFEQVDIRVRAALDEVFGVTNNKQHANKLSEMCKINMNQLLELEDVNSITELKEQLEEEDDPNRYFE